MPARPMKKTRRKAINARPSTASSMGTISVYIIGRLQAKMKRGCPKIANFSANMALPRRNFPPGWIRAFPHGAMPRERPAFGECGGAFFGRGSRHGRGGHAAARAGRRQSRRWATARPRPPIRLCRRVISIGGSLRRPQLREACLRHPLPPHRGHGFAKPLISKAKHKPMPIPGGEHGPMAPCLFKFSRGQIAGWKFSHRGIAADGMPEKPRSA